MKERLDTEAARNLEELRVKEIPDLPPLPAPGPSRRSPRDRKNAPRQKVLEKPMKVLEQPSKAEVSVEQNNQKKQPDSEAEIETSYKDLTMRAAALRK